MVLVKLNVATPEAFVLAVIAPLKDAPPAATAFSVTKAFTIGEPPDVVTV